MSVVVPVKIPKELAKELNELVKNGLYSSRSNLVREAMRRLAASESPQAQKASIEELAANLASTMIAWNERPVTDVIFFGSSARGEATTESDVDLLVLTEEAHPWRVRRHLYDVIYPIIPVLGIDISLIVINRESFRHMIERADPFAFSVINEGIQLHGEFLNEHRKSTHGESS